MCMRTRLDWTVVPKKKQKKQLKPLFTWNVVLGINGVTPHVTKGKKSFTQHTVTFAG